MKKSEKFDEWLKDRLDHYNPAETHKNKVWDQLKQSLKKHQDEEVLFDQFIKDKLSKYEHSAPKSDWNHFLIKYRERAARRRRIMGIRVAELSLLILLLLTFDKFYKQYMPIHDELRSVDNSSIDKNSYEKNTSHFSQLNKPNTSDKESFMPRSEKSQSYTDQKIKANQQKDRRIKNKSWNKNYSNSQINSKGNDLTFTQTETEPTILFTSSESSEQVNENSAGLLQIPTTNQELEDIQCLDRKETSILFSPKMEGVMFSRWISHKTKEFTIWAHAQSGAGINFIRTPHDILLGDHPQKRIGNLVLARASVLFDHGRWNLESGIEYSVLKDQPKICDIYKHQSGDFYKSELSSSNYQILEIPILAHVVILYTGPVSMTLGGGISVAANLSSQFSRKDEIYNVTPTQGVSFIPRLSYLDEKPYINGLLRHEEFNQNSFANLILMSRIYYRHRSNLRFFSEVQFKKMLSSYGFGPLSDYYRQIGISLGVSRKI
ncbi:MAG: hypothetical protein IPM48_14200 [Saprospiraceae bacterium]|nr:hypothetical protein [Saprospiraceae bacterium]